MEEHRIVSRAEWLTARKALLAREKEATHLRDAVNAERLALPWVAVERDYLFETPEGRRSLADLFDSRNQLVVYHFMLAPDWEAGCHGCSLVAETFDGALPHLENHDVTLVAVSRAPLDKIEAYKARMGWRFPWVSSFGSPFNFDYGVSFSKDDLEAGGIEYNFARLPKAQYFEEQPGLSAFAKGDDGRVFHTYSAYSRGLEDLVGTLMILDRAPKGRNERSAMDFVRRHDEYAAPRDSACRHGKA